MTNAVPITCDQSVQKEFERGLALLHSFWYEEAQKSFKEVLDHDRHCDIALMESNQENGKLVVTFEVSLKALNSEPPEEEYTNS